MDNFERRSRPHGFGGLPSEVLADFSTVEASNAQYALEAISMTERMRDACGIMVHIAHEVIGDLPMFAFGNNRLREMIVSKLNALHADDRCLLAHAFGDTEEAAIGALEMTIKRLHEATLKS